MKMTSKPTPACLTGQQRRIFELLFANRNRWVSLPVILELKVSQYGSRVYDLRKKFGLEIKNRVEVRDGKKCSWFMLVWPEPRGSENRPDHVSSDNLFDDAAPANYRYPD